MTRLDIRCSCSSCGGALPEATAAPCPVCGSSLRTVAVAVEEALSFHESVRLRSGTGPRRGWTELLLGADLQRSTGRWMHMERLVDPQANRYREIIRDAATGQLIRECDEPLREHRGRGAARRLAPEET